MFDYDELAQKIGFENKGELHSYLLKNQTSLVKGRIINLHSYDGLITWRSTEEDFMKIYDNFDDIVLLVNSTREITYDFGYFFITNESLYEVEHSEFFYLCKLACS